MSIIETSSLRATPPPNNTDRNTGIWISVAMTLAIAAILIAFMHPFSEGAASHHGCGCCCCGGGGMGGASGQNGTVASGPIHSGNPNTIITSQPTGVIDINIDPRISPRTSVTITLTTISNSTLILSGANLTGSPITIYPGIPQTVYYMNHPEVVDWMLSWAPSPPNPQLVQLMRNQPYNPGEYNGTYSFNFNGQPCSANVNIISN